MRTSLLLLMGAVLFPASTSSAQVSDVVKLRFFETNIRPALVKYCCDCHSVEKGESRGGLVLDFREGLLQGGDSGPAIEPGKPENSLFWEAINWESFEMPPSQKMPAAVIANFRTWIAMGAPDPRERKKLHHKSKISALDIREGLQHWSFQKPKRKTDTTIDGLVTAKHREAGVNPSAPADAYTLLRRINFDLVGLPPNPSELRTFEAAFKRNADAAVKEKVDELLAREQYGERWGRHWMDVARYAESSGSRNVPYPYAWRYRDYVIDSFNDDTPYDRFIKEQIAGDLLPVKSDEQWQENLIATGFLAIGLKHQDQKNPRQFISDMVDEQIDTMTQAVLGLTVACARCHDHKYDPIPTADYYALAGIFQSTTTYYGTIRAAQNHRSSELLLLPIADENPITPGKSQQELQSLKARIAELDRQAARVQGKERRNIRNQRNRLASQVTELNADGTPKTFAMGVQESETIVNANILISGEIEKPAQEVPRGFIQVLDDLNFTVRNAKASGRLELVDALTSKNNPLTARVMVNRIWMNLLGKPLVETPSNFGFSGMKPKNQELLDHLAIRFMDLDWSIKDMVREIVMTDTYRRSSKYNARNYDVDPENNFLWRANPRSLEAESLRDAMLALSGQLDLERPVGSAVAEKERPRSLDTDLSVTYRSVYLPIVRDQLPSSLDLFDFPDPNMTSAGRSESIVPTQALYMMNNEFVMAQSKGMAASLASLYPSQNDRVNNAFLWAYGRPATSDELQASARFFREFVPSGATAAPAQNTLTPRQRPGARRKNAQRTAGRPGRATASNVAATSTANTEALAVFCQTLMASARFRILN